MEADRMSASAARVAHVNLMTDTVIANLNPDALRVILRSMLAADENGQLTHQLQHHVQKYLRHDLQRTSVPALFSVTDKSTSTASASSSSSAQPTPVPTPELAKLRGRICSLLGSGLAFESLQLLAEVVRQSRTLELNGRTPEGERLAEVLAAVDGDLVQALTAVQKVVTANNWGKGEIPAARLQVLLNLRADLEDCRERSEGLGVEFGLGRGSMMLENILSMIFNPAIEASTVATPSLLQGNERAIEHFQLGPFTVPRLFIGLWQLSSPAWGSASKSKILSQFQKHVDSGFTAFADMADHYGDAEIVFGEFRSSYSGPKSIFCATKYCVFEHITVTPDGMRDEVSQRLANIKSDKIDLLQFHWHDYNDTQYIRALQLLQDDERVAVLGLCNFDTKRMEEVIGAGVKIATNQVQFSLIDTRPTYAMAEACEKHNIKLLTYGTLCGGFLAEKWIGKDEPDAFGAGMTPSLRKYLEMINIWGPWSLFQTLLETLSTIGRKHNASVSAVAIRWVLDFSYVGAVLVGARMGVSEHTEDNLAVYGWQLDAEDKRMLEEVLCQSRRGEIFSDMGDCGAEYRR
ncbi:hypothetical protein EMPG_17493 [Blastomyces silverae]|uniref:NADP-dependent oxidoreductase domain-containing protein n=1 Tax=Blastomyces silverae TaxID=2060906 RepID=A0A0H1B7F0_9EURO|nr:hypothetical protein EMPG_17493 [Blastomyces silverae]